MCSCVQKGKSALQWAAGGRLAVVAGSLQSLPMGTSRGRCRIESEHCSLRCQDVSGEYEKQHGLRLGMVLPHLA